ncbi:hypothetical protein D3C81_1218300 [compost metagenome]
MAEFSFGLIAELSLGLIAEFKFGLMAEFSLGLNALFVRGLLLAKKVAALAGWEMEATSRSNRKSPSESVPTVKNILPASVSSFAL